MADSPGHWMDAEDFRRLARFFWPLLVDNRQAHRDVAHSAGYTKMHWVNNTWAHYQDNRPEWFLDEPSRRHLNVYPIPLGGSLPPRPPTGVRITR